jgi:AAA15 family ATPase/GTPase
MEIKISTLRVIECGPLKDVIIDFNDSEKNWPQSVTILAGANGSGKTTTLELIFSLLDLFKFSPEANSDFINNLNIVHILKQTEYAELRLIIDNEICIVFWGEIEHNDKIKNIHGIQRYFDEEGNKKWKIYSKGHIPKKINAFVNNLEKTPLDFPFYPYNEPKNYQIPTILYFPYNRELLNVKGDQVYREQGNYYFNYRYQINRTFKGSFESYLIWLDYSDQELFHIVIQFLNHLNFGGKKFNIRRKDLSVIVTTKDQSQHELSALSSGEQSLLIMLLEIRRRIIPGSIVIIDEIENSLHPEFQYLIAKSLMNLQKEIQFQLLLTTHQHEFVKIFGRNNARILTEF